MQGNDRLHVARNIAQKIMAMEARNQLIEQNVQNIIEMVNKNRQTKKDLIGMVDQLIG